MIKALIVDDEIQGRKLLKALLDYYCAEVEVIGESADLPNAVKAIRKLKPSLVFLDIEMPGHSGLEIADFFEEGEMDFAIIFTTAYAEHAIQGYKLSAIDYLLKPIEGQELAIAVNRFAAKQQKGKAESPLQMLPDKIAIPVAQSIKFFEVDKITYLKAINTYTEIHFEDNTKILVSRILKNFEEAMVAFPQMQRCHKSYIVNRKFVIDYVKSDGGFLIVKPNVEIPISSDRVASFLAGSVIIKRN